MSDGLAALKVRSQGEHVKRLQRALNKRGKPYGYPPLLTDGELGPATQRAFVDLGYALGLSAEMLDAPEISAEAQRLIEDPSKRQAKQMELERKRAPGLAQRTIALDGAPTYWGLARPLLQARAAGWSGKLRSSDRRKGVAERFGKKSQAALYECSLKLKRTGKCPVACGGDCNPANAPGHSSHEQRSDGVAFSGPPGRLLQWWELGLDVDESDELLAVLKGLKHKVRRPYRSASEHHHLNFTANPGPVSRVPRTPKEKPGKQPGRRRGPTKVAGKVSGPDVSIYQGDIDWDKVKKAGHEFAICKATEGLDWNDPTFSHGRWQALRKAGLVRGVYHFARPQPGRDPKGEARHFLRVVGTAGGLEPGDLAPVLDLEWQRGLNARQVLAWTEGFVKEIERQVGRKPIIYTGSFWRDVMANTPDNLGCELWLAAYVKSPGPYIPAAWKHEGWAIWQHTSEGTCPGIRGNCDLNQVPGPRVLERLLLAGGA